MSMTDTSQTQTLLGKEETIASSPKRVAQWPTLLSCRIATVLLSAQPLQVPLSNERHDSGGVVL